MASVALTYAGAGHPNFASYQRWTLASFRTSTEAGTSVNSSAALAMTASSASQLRSESSK